MRRFELRDEKSSKFWEISVEGAAVTVRFGKIGTNGQTQAKTHPTPAKGDDGARQARAGKDRKSSAELGAAAITATPAPAAPSKPAKPKAATKAPARDASDAHDEPGWIDAANGYRVALRDGKVVCRSPKGQKLASLSKELRETEAV